MPYEAVGLFFNVCLLFYLTKKGESPMDYYIKLKNTQIPVTEEVYKAYCQGARKERYFRESDIRNQTFFYDIYGDSLRQLSRTTAVPATTLQARHQRLLKKLKNILEK